MGIEQLANEEHELREAEGHYSLSTMKENDSSGWRVLPTRRELTVLGFTGSRSVTTTH
jgi:hypothetical protein